MSTPTRLTTRSPQKFSFYNSKSAQKDVGQPNGIENGAPVDGLAEKKRKLSFYVSTKAVRNPATGRFEKVTYGASAPQSNGNGKTPVKPTVSKPTRTKTKSVKLSEPRGVPLSLYGQEAGKVLESTKNVLPEPGTMFAFLYRNFWYVVIVPDQLEINECMRVHEMKKNNNYHYNSNNAEFNIAKNKNIKSTIKNCFVRFLGETFEMKYSEESSVLNRSYIYINLSKLVSAHEIIDEDDAMISRQGTSYALDKDKKKKTTLFIYDPFTWNEIVEKPDFDSDFDSIKEAETRWASMRPSRIATKSYFIKRYPGIKLPVGFRSCDTYDYSFPDFNGEETATLESSERLGDEGEPPVQSTPKINGHNKSVANAATPRSKYTDDGKDGNDQDLAEGLLLLGQQQGITLDNNDEGIENEAEDFVENNDSLEGRAAGGKKKFTKFSDAHPESWARFQRRIDVFWPMDNRWYRGTIVKFFRKSLIHVVRYDVDAEEEALDLINKKETFRWLDEDLPFANTAEPIDDALRRATGDPTNTQTLQGFTLPGGTHDQPNGVNEANRNKKSSGLKRGSELVLAPLNARDDTQIKKSKHRYRDLEAVLMPPPQPLMPLMNTHQEKSLTHPMPVAGDDVIPASGQEIIPVSGEEAMPPMVTHTDGHKHLHIHASLQNLHTHLHIHTKHTHIHIHNLQ